MRTPTIAACLAAVAVAAAEASAQAPFRSTESASGVWVNYTGDYAVADRWSYLFDVSVRRGDFASVWRTLLVRPAVQWQLSPAIRFGGGYTFSYVYPAGSQSGLHTPEHRIFQQAVLSHSAGDVSLSHRYRFENRWFGQHDSAGPDERITGWLKRQRFRYQVKATLPLGSGRTYLSAFDEIFINMGANVRYNVFDQNRFAAGVGVRITPVLRLETYYQNYLVLHADGRGVDRNHVWMTVLSSTHALRRNARQ